MRDYSEIQCGKSICDRLSGSAKLRMKAYINSGNDVMNASDIKKGIQVIFNSTTCFDCCGLTGIEYGGGVKNLKIGVGEVLQLSERLPKKKVPEVSSIRNILYGDTSITLRKAVSSIFTNILSYY